MHDQEKVVSMLHTQKYLFSGTTLLSFYHLARFSSLSPSGRILAPFGAVASLWGLYSIGAINRGIRSDAGLDQVQEPVEAAPAN